MDEHRIKYIQCGDVQIAASCETNCERITEVYHPSTLLLYTQKGNLHVTTKDQSSIIAAGEYAVLKKYTEASMFKTWSDEEGEARTYGFGLTNEFLERVISEISLPNRKRLSESFFRLKPTKKLDDLMESIILHVDTNDKLDPKLVEEKTLEALKALAEADVKILEIFHEFSIKQQGDLEKLMKHNFLYKIPLKVLAVQSGRSLSTFNRDFKKLFNDTPHNWIKKQRLYFAKKMMKEHKMKPSHVYLESGFEDLAHFSKAFKKQFNKTPRDFYKSIL